MIRSGFGISSTISYPRGASASSQSAVASGVPAWKRALDVSCILLAMPVILPIGLLIALLIKIVSPGPVLFKQERIGFRSRRFMCLKFRTMHVNSDTGVHQGHLQTLMKSNQPMMKLDSKGDPRLIRFGLLLRSLGLDEIPQLINVVRGEMSLVGPRPCIPYEFDQFMPRHRQRCGALPGLTGLWQVSGKNRTTFEEMMDLDIFYVRNQSLLMDLGILFRTIPAVLVQVWEVKVLKRPLGTPKPVPSQVAAPHAIPAAE